MRHFAITLTDVKGARAMFIVEAPTGRDAVRRLLDEVTHVFVNLKIEEQEIVGVFLQ